MLYVPLCMDQVGSWRSDDDGGQQWQLRVSEAGVSLEGIPEKAPTDTDGTPLLIADVPADCPLVSPFSSPCAGIRIQMHGANVVRFTLSVLTTTMTSHGSSGSSSSSSSSSSSAATLSGDAGDPAVDASDDSSSIARSLAEAAAEAVANVSVPTRTSFCLTVRDACGC